MSELIPLGSWVDQSVHYLLDHDAKTFDAIGRAIEGLAALVEHSLQAVPMWLMMAIFIGVGLWRVGWRFAIFTAASLFLIFATGFWDQTVVTLGLTLSSTIVSLVLGIPLGIWAAKSKWVAAIVRPILDLMQTMPAFVYLIPAAMLFGLGRVPGILSTVIFAMPPAVRLTSLGIRHVNREIVEAGQAFGCTPWQLLYKVQFPNALPSIMQGVNQTIMMALSMVIIASMVGAGGLGNDVLASIQRLDIGLGFESGLSVVLLAIILDRITESFGRAPGTAKAPLFSGFRQLFGPRSRSSVAQA
ncbi:choline ABC transporter permease subunit [Burkholderia thailandensis]|uniref:Glycine betaine/L-proline ABC transporter, permease protein, putative n=1 Tax=Burkholderia thailandensis (strain ATCC 700388 / DSM 13276 / CCUG 48851 / CIP 106301 / E264) TaxID=271848 RepID=Q2T6N5_BURTA|nr:choline ABC transporter permease subunit [Burkholderia thailandensis]ABC34017.1 glycine betaine/L-proline ABC transporter, permease protein, putative [Burkholderia thailandensis E264]AHI68365.1 choline ABC transporter, permease protein [Burkholderia thailandensis H0587]AHI75856.1 choline ABC transporter, permease protein [Burkholderia thailandensis 2002721723]AHI80566.1 choline ABC transporter, permease protein [Burkholderia thailandensis E444]AIC90866.1 choline ABC transporter, permease pr